MKKVVRLRAIEQVVNQLIPTEVALDETISSAAKLIEVCLKARSDAALSLSCGSEALKGMSKIVDLLIQARQELIAVHNELVDVRTVIGLGELSYGAIGRCPGRPHAVNLSIVAQTV